MNDKKIVDEVMESVDKGNFEEGLQKMNAYVMNRDQYIPEGKSEIFSANSYSLDVSLIRVRLKECQLTLKQLHEQVNVSYRTVTRWLSKDEFPKHANLMRLAEVLQLEPHELVRKKYVSSSNPIDDGLRLVRRRIEKLVTEIMDDKEATNEIKLDALDKFHNILLKEKKSSK